MNTTKSLLVTLMAFALILMPMPFTVYGQSVQKGTVVTESEQGAPFNAQSGQTATKAPSVSQELVPEGDFALKLVTALQLGTATTETQAEDMLIFVGISPNNGWIADYPMTPIIIGQVQSSVVAAAATKKLPMEKDEALKAFQGLTTEFGLSVSPGSDRYAESQPATSSEYVQPSVVDSYYYEEGPPVVTYYPPPWDYYYLYAWVPYPFWCTGFFFPGFFVLNDFDIDIGHHHGHHGHDGDRGHDGHHDHHMISNHFTDPKTHSVSRVDPTTRTMGRTVTASLSHNHAFNSTEARRGATSIFERSRSRQTANVNPTLRGASRGQGTIRSPGSRQLGPLGPRNNMSSRSGAGSFGSPSRSFSAPRSFSSPSFGGRESFGGFQGGGGSFGHSSFSGGFHSGGFGGGGGFHGGGGGHR